MKYTITVDAGDSLASIVNIKQLLRTEFGNETDITVDEHKSSTSVEHREPFVNLFHEGELIVSISEKYDELLLYQSETDEPVSVHELSELVDGNELP
jgi:hypothetical protein